MASALTVGIGIFYWGVLVKQAGPEGALSEIQANTLLVTVAIAVLAFLPAYGSFAADPTRRAVALWVAVPGLAVLGYLAGFSIGGLFWVVAIVVLLAAIPAFREPTVRARTVFGWAAGAAVAWLGVGWLIIWLAGQTGQLA